jgi:hypothetical protein
MAGVLRRGRVRQFGLLLILAVALVPLGVPRGLAGRGDADRRSPRVDVSAMCLAHGGMPAPAPAGPRSACTVRYGDRTYRMDAITPAGFDADAARFQRQGCAVARRAQAAETGTGPVFVFHADTGVCERRD